CDDGRLVFRFRFEVPGDLLMQGLLAASREAFIRRLLHERMVEAAGSLAVVIHTPLLARAKGGAWSFPLRRPPPRKSHRIRAVARAPSAGRSLLLRRWPRAIRERTGVRRP